MLHKTHKKAKQTSQLTERLSDKYVFVPPEFWNNQWSQPGDKNNLKFMIPVGFKCWMWDYQRRWSTNLRALTQNLTDSLWKEAGVMGALLLISVWSLYPAFCTVSIWWQQIYENRLKVHKKKPLKINQKGVKIPKHYW